MSAAESANSVVARKAEIRAKQEPERLSKRERRRQARRCYWSWPFGHIYDPDISATDYARGWECAACGWWVDDGFC